MSQPMKSFQHMRLDPGINKRKKQFACKHRSSHSGISTASLFPDLAPCDFFLGLRTCLVGNDSQVPEKCSVEGTRGSGKRRLTICVYLFE
ncbi:hypothetical protein AVEN_150672-1 [Araneus ventricosus]|uniref:Uncharacterized protein n=1 Tax=Araneus ventricosus TaxID=182803 RepID=A0A4Y2PD17_ARAVE|nr:hypothetical protein AVEN_150672-1 [Araneus ventricosus]